MCVCVCVCAWRPCLSPLHQPVMPVVALANMHIWHGDTIGDTVCFDQDEADTRCLSCLIFFQNLMLYAHSLLPVNSKHFTDWTLLYKCTGNLTCLETTLSPFFLKQICSSGPHHISVTLPSRCETEESGTDTTHNEISSYTSEYAGIQILYMCCMSVLCCVINSTFILFIISNAQYEIHFILYIFLKNFINFHERIFFYDGT